MSPCDVNPAMISAIVSAEILMFLMGLVTGVVIGSGYRRRPK